MKKPLTKEQIAALKPGSVAKFIIGKFIKKENINYASDMAGAMRLVKLITPNPFFWNSLTVDIQFDSIYQMLTPNSINFLKNKYNHFKLELKPEIKYSLGEKTGEDLVINKQKNSVMEFLKE